MSPRRKWVRRCIFGGAFFLGSSGLFSQQEGSATVESWSTAHDDNHSYSCITGNTNTLKKYDRGQLVVERVIEVDWQLYLVKEYEDYTHFYGLDTSTFICGKEEVIEDEEYLVLLPEGITTQKHHLTAEEDKNTGLTNWLVMKLIRFLEKAQILAGPGSSQESMDRKPEKKASPSPDRDDSKEWYKPELWEKNDSKLN